MVPEIIVTWEHTGRSLRQDGGRSWKVSWGEDFLAEFQKRNKSRKGE